MKRSAVISGIDGQDGQYLRALLVAQGLEVAGLAKPPLGSPAGGVACPAAVDELVARVRPDFFFHLAASSTTRHDVLFENHATIVTGTLNILEAIRRHRPDCRVFLAGSGLQFVNTGAPISEHAPFAPSSAYALARIQSVYAARYYRQLGVKAYVGYLFHHESPLRKPMHLSRMIADAAQRIAAGSEERIRLGDISVRKEMAFAGDIVAGIWTLVQQDRIFEAAIGTGVGYSIQDWLEVCFARIGKEWSNYVAPMPDFVPEFQTLVSNPATMNSLGWRPQTSIDELARMMLTGTPATTTQG